MGWFLAGAGQFRQKRWGTLVAIWVVAGPCALLAVYGLLARTAGGGDANTWSEVGVVMGLFGYIAMAVAAELDARKAAP